MTPLSQGILLCLFSQLLFGVLYLFSHWMKPLGGTDVFALRMLTMAAGIWLMTLYSIGLPALGRFVRERLGALGATGCCLQSAPPISAASFGCLCGRR